MDLSNLFNNLSWESILGAVLVILLTIVIIKLLIMVYLVKVATNAALDEIEKRQLASRQQEKQEIIDYIEQRLAENQQAAQASVNQDYANPPWQGVPR